MRWLFIEPTNRAEMARRAQKLRNIDDWWAAFVEQSPKFDAVFTGEAQWDLPEWMAQHLSPVDQRLMWEFGPAVETDGHRLVVTPEAEHQLRPLVETLLQRAPVLPGWEFYGCRLPEEPEQAVRSAAGRTGVDISAWSVSLRANPQRKIDLTFCPPDCRRADDEVQLGAAFVTAETLLGEELLDRWVGAVEIAPPPTKGLLSRLTGKRSAVDARSLLPLDRIQPTASALISSISEQLPDVARYSSLDSTEWATIELSPTEQEDYAEREDLLVAVTSDLVVWQAAHAGGLFDSACHSRCGETFCYVKIDGADGLPESCAFEGRDEIEDALNAAIAEPQLGCVTGGGTGLRYSYIDLALVDLRAGVNAVRRVLADGGLPQRTWIQFFDARLSGEWIGVQEDSPTPPR